MKKQIIVSPQVRKEIQVAFRCSSVALWRALNEWTDTDMSRRLRKFALDKGGEMVITAPAVETIHCTDGKMFQFFPNGARLVAHMSSGLVVVYDRHGVEMMRQDACTLGELERLQYMTLAMGRADRALEEE